MEFSTLNGYKVKDKKAIRFYDTVDDMINDSTLKEGMHAKTKGYYNVNDGGGAEYHITATQSNSDYQEELDNGLYGKLISKEVNVKMFGAKGDNETDDTQAFKNAISYLNKNDTLYIPSGYYLISENIKFKDTISLVGESSVPYLVFTGLGNFITIEGHVADTYDYSGYNANADKKYILSNLVLTTDDTGLTGKSGTFGINFDTADSKIISRSTFDNVRITRFEKGIIFPNRNFYIMTFNNISLDNNTNGVYLALDGGYTNAGERITFSNSVIDNNTIAIYLNNLKYDMNFDNCSIDYNKCFIYAPITDTTSGGKISVTNSHYETKYPDITTDTNPHGIFYGNMPYSSLVLSNNMIWTSVKEKQFYKSVSGPSTKIYLLNNNFWYVTGDYNYYTLNHFYTIEDFPVVADNNMLGSGNMALPISIYQNINKVPGLTYLNATGTATVDSSNKLMDTNIKDTHWRVTNPSNVESYSIVGTLNPVNKIYKPLLIENSTLNDSITVDISEDSLLSFENNKPFYFNISGKNLKEVSVVVGYYDQAGTLIVNEQRTTLFSGNTIEDTTLVIPHSTAYYPNLKTRPTEAKFKVTFRFIGIEGKDIEINAMSIYAA